MPRSRRIFYKNKLYEIVPRAREGLPLPPTETSRQLLAGIYARSQRDDKVILCNMVDMNNHQHILAIPKEANKFAKFYMEVQKKTTDSVKKLTGLAHLRLWESRTGVTMATELEDAIGRHVYGFLNPVRAGLVDSIDNYPGLNSWQAFKSCPASVDATVTKKCYWTPPSAIGKLPEGNKLSAEEDRLMAQRLREHKKTVEHDLVFQPFKWLEIYGITEPELIEAIRQRIIRTVYQEEEALRKKRSDNGASVIGIKALLESYYMMPHTPKKRPFSIWFVCSDKSKHPQLRATKRGIDDECRRCFKLLQQGQDCEWPKGTFKPGLPPKELQPQLNPGFV